MINYLNYLYICTPEPSAYMVRKKTPQGIASTENRIREAAHRIFRQKGYAGTRTRDIAEDAGINLALLNYYFRSKEKLFYVVMLESMQYFVHAIRDLMNDPRTSVQRKIELITDRYIDMLLAEPNFPFFILSEIQVNPEGLLKESGIREIFINSYFAKQLKSHFKKVKLSIHPIQLLISFAGLTVFPFAGKQMIMAIGPFQEREFHSIMLERKKLIPLWIHTMLKLKY